MEMYDQHTAAHYAAYRPPLHEVILQKCLGGRRFSYSLDIGCGTGSSTIPLTHFCDRVAAIDPSRDMLQKAVHHPQVAYTPFNGQDLEFDDSLFDLVTFAGSIVYAKSQRMLDETIRVARLSAIILLYDFEILIDPVFKLLEIPRSTETSIYNHRENFDGLNQEGIELMKASEEQISLPIQREELAHLLLSDSHDYALLAEHLGEADLFDKLGSILSRARAPHHVSANLYYSLYQRTGYSI